MSKHLSFLIISFLLLACERAPEEIAVTSVTITQPTAEMIIGETVQLQVSIAPSNATDKTTLWSSSKKSVATVNNDGLVTAVAAGNTTITAAAGGKFGTCLVTVSKGFVAVTSVSLNTAKITLEEDETTTLTATVLPEDATDKSVVWTSSAGDIAIVKDGLVTALNAGTCTITAKAGEKSAQCTIEVKPKVIAVTEISLNKSRLSLVEGDFETLVATVKPDNATDKSVSWSCSNVAIATVTSNGKVTALMEGTAIITASAGNKQAACIVEVSKKVIPVSLISLNKSSLTLEKGKTETLVATVTPTNATDKTVIWSSSDAFVATVDQTGNVTAIKEGETTITATAGGQTASCSVIVTPHHYLTFSSEGTSTISLENNGGNAPTLYYSKDAVVWKLWDYSELTFTQDSPIYLCGDNPRGFSSFEDKYSSFRTIGSNTYCSGSIMSLLDKDGELPNIPWMYCFYKLFYNCNITTAPELPATTLAQYCYFCMFEGCASLTSAPELPATTLAQYCYSWMFEGCTSLTSAPELPATTLADSCYMSMFAGCASLTSAPELPATTLVGGCYHGMFRGCTSLTSAPALPATTLAGGCYSCMFDGCTSLTSAPALPATTLAGFCYAEMFDGCTSLTSAPALPVTTLANYCYYYMFRGCTSLTSAPALPATTLAQYCYSWMFEGCTSLTSAPELPATTLVGGCYWSMFKGCSSLNYIKCLATDISADICIRDWLFGVAAAGTFYKNPAMESWPRGASGIPEGWIVRNSGTAEPVAVDLGLSVKWASFNLGASKPNEYGDYIAWGEVESYYESQNPLIWKDGKTAGYNWDSYKWSNGDYNKLTKYCPTDKADYWDGTGSPDGKAALDLEDDAARANWGGTWRMPTDAEWTELKENCIWISTTLNGVKGELVTSIINGNSIFLPAAGDRDGTGLISAGSYGNYWSSSLVTDSPSRAWNVRFNSSAASRQSASRYLGRSVRPVRE